MNATLKAVLIPAVVTIGLSVSGGWLAGNTTQTVNVVKIQTIEKQIKTLSVIPEREHAIEKRVIALEVQAKTAFYQIGKIDNNLIAFNERVQDSQLASAKITTAIEQFTLVIKDLSTLTGRLSDVVSRLDERVKTLEKEGIQDAFHK